MSTSPVNPALAPSLLAPGATSPRRTASGTPAFGGPARRGHPRGALLGSCRGASRPAWRVARRLPARRLDGGVAQAASKGSRSALVMVDRVAMIVAVPERTVVTAMPTDQAGQGVFTNIDAAVVA